MKRGTGAGNCISGRLDKMSRVPHLQRSFVVRNCRVVWRWKGMRPGGICW